MANNAIRVLIVEDSEDDAQLLLRHLRQGGYEPVWEMVSTAEAMERALASGRWDIVISDYVMPHFSGIDALKVLQGKGKDMPFIVVSGKIGEEVAVEAMKAGASDYLMKNSLQRLTAAVGQAIKASENGIALKKAEDDLRQKERDYKTLFENAGDAIILADAESEIILDMNKMAEKMLGMPKEEIIGKNRNILHPPHGEYASQFSNHVKSKQVSDVESIVINNKGEYVPVRISAAILEMNGRKVIQGIFRDISARKEAEAELKTTNLELQKTRDEIDDALKISERSRHALLSVLEDEKAVEKELSKEKAYLKHLFAMAPEGIVVHDQEGKLLQVNQEFLKMFGYVEEEVLGQNIDKLIVPKEKYREACNLTENVTKGQMFSVETIRSRKNGTIMDVSIIGAPIIVEGQQTAVYAIYRDISVRKQAEEALQESEINYRTLADSGQALIWTAGTDKLCNYFNKVWLNFTGRPLEQELGNGWFDGVHPDDQQLCLKIYTDAFDRREIFSMEYRLRRYDGEYRWIRDDGSPRYNSAGEFIGYIGHCLDITERKEAEKLLRQQEKDYRTLTQNIPGVVYRVHIMEKNRMQFFNKSVEELTGYQESELINGKICSIEPLIDSQDKHRVEAVVLDAIKNKIPFEVEYRLIHKSGKIKHLLERGQPVYNEDGSPYYVDGIILDITLRKIAEQELKERENRLQMIFNILPVGLWFADMDGKLVTGNPAGVRIWGAEPHVPIEEYGIFKARRLPNGNEIAPNDWALAHTIKEGVIITDELLEIDAFDGEKKIILNYTAPILDDNGRVQGAIVVNNDITARYRAEELVKASLKEKEVMLKEIHHRVKNNLQIIASLLNLQTGYVKDERYKKMFLESQSRVRSMALVHEKLYKSKDLSGIDFSDYINGLMSDLYSSYGMTQNDVALDTDILKDKIPIDLAIPCGLIINELATNSFKYAFKEKKAKGLIFIALKRDDSGLYTLEVNDNGPGIKNDLDLKNTPTLGLQLVDALVGQLDAEIKITNDGGTKVTIKFKV